MRFFTPLVVRYAPVATPEGVGPAAPAVAAAKTGDITLTNIIKLIPGDVVAIYLAARGAVPSDQSVLGLRWPLFLTLACLVVCVLLRFLATRAGSGVPNWTLIVVTALAFLIWAHAIYPDRPGPIISDLYGSVAGVLAMLFGVVAPKLVPGAPDI
jgi:hypothetical protein